MPASGRVFGAEEVVELVRTSLDFWLTTGRFAAEFEARMARAHNDANVLCLGERVTGPGLGAAIVEAFLATPFEGGRHARRVEKVSALDRR